MTTLATELVGYCAATITTVAFVPQVIQALRTKDLSSVSLAMYVTFCIGIALWLVYGLMLQAWPVVIANIFTLGLAGVVLALKVKQVMAQKRADKRSV
jgi:MtN3 and saliva related transmembrane protein